MAAGFQALLVTIDVPVGANRENNLRSGFTLPLQLSPRVIADGLLHPRWLSVLADSGFRRGGDILKGIALGAQLVLCGRLFLYGAALGGEAGVAHALQLLKAEVDRDLAMLGATGIADLASGDLVID